MEGYAVEPKLDCPHIKNHFVPFTKQKIEIIGSKCKECNDTNENWFCAKCHTIHCSRYINSHLVKHYEKDESHCIGISFCDLSVWCYKCESYIKSPIINDTLQNLANLKFNNDNNIQIEEGNNNNNNNNKELINKQNEKRKKCTKEGCENYGNEENDGVCNKCRYGFLPFGPNYAKWFKDMPKYPEPKVYRKAEIEENPNKTEMGKKTGALSKEDLTEYMDEPEVLKEKAKLLASLIKESKYMVTYTGAGISTSCKIPDYRGPQGVWTLQSIGKKVEKKISLTLALPSPCHYSLVKLHQEKILKCTVSTNVDGLHKRSGIPTDELLELHGNIYLEKCNTCKREYFRKFAVGGGRNHVTGRRCEQKGCEGLLLDSIIHFGENLPVKEITSAVDHSNLCDLALVLGTSMRVAPACNLPELIWKDKNKPPGKLVIVNLQNTPYDKHCFLRVYSKTDEFMELVMKELFPNFDIQQFTKEKNENIEKMGQTDDEDDIL